MGGAIFNHGGTVRLTNSTLTANVARGGLGQSPTANGSGFGGAVFNLNGTVQAVFTTLAGNTAPQGGGALFSLGDNGVATQAGPALPSTPARVTLKNSILSDSTGGTADFVQRAHASDGSSVGTVLSDGVAVPHKDAGGTRPDLDGVVARIQTILAAQPSVKRALIYPNPEMTMEQLASVVDRVSSLNGKPLFSEVSLAIR
jgi:hypothetical protein